MKAWKHLKEGLSMERVEQMLRYALQLSYLNQLHKAGKITESEYLRIKKNLMKDYGVVSDILAGWK